MEGVALKDAVEEAETETDGGVLADTLGETLVDAEMEELAASEGVILGETVVLPVTDGETVAEKLNEAGIAKQVKVNVVPKDSSLSMGPFDIRYVPLAHSIAEGNALVIDLVSGWLQKNLPLSH
jgi:ribonuclease J